MVIEHSAATISELEAAALPKSNLGTYIYYAFNGWRNYYNT